MAEDGQKVFSPSAGACAEYEVRKSRFIANAAPISSRDDALQLKETLALRYPDARHHCWAFIIGSPKDARQVAFSDDGEPGGTAGRPILNVLQHGEIGNVLVVVSRYFGGVKLGAGGLVRAYGTAASLVLDQLPVAELREMSNHQVMGDFGLEQAMRHWLSQNQGELLAVKYTEGATFQLAIPSDKQELLMAFCAASGLKLTV